MMGNEPLNLPYIFSLSVPTNIFDGKPTEVSGLLTNNVHSGFRLADDLLTGNLYDAKPTGIVGRFKNIFLRTPLVLGTTLINHEVGHNKIQLFFDSQYSDFEIGQSHHFYKTTYPVGGLEQSFNLANHISYTWPIVGTNYSLALLYTATKFDRLLQDYVDNIRISFGLEPYENPQTDIKEIKGHIGCARQPEKCEDDKAPTSRDAGYDFEANIGGTLFHFGNFFNLIDPILLWSTYQLVAGDGSPPPWYLPQFDYLETPNGPMFKVGMRYPFLNSTSVMKSGAGFIWNNKLDGENGFTLDLGMLNVPIINNRLFFDASYQMSSTPQDGPIANIRTAVRIPINNSTSLYFGFDHKLGNGYITDAQFFEGPSISGGFTLTP